jgi:hypothetical protein
MNPISDRADRAFGVSAVWPNVLPRDVGDELPVAVLIGVEDQRALPVLVFRSIPLTAEEQPEFQRHIKPRQVRGWIQSYSREVIDSEAALFNHALDLRQPEVRSIVFLQSTARNETQIVHCEDNGVEDRLVAGIEGTVDEDVTTF